MEPPREYLLPFHQQGFFELGGVAGVPSGINLRYWFLDFLGIDSSIGASVNHDLSFTADLLYENIEITRTDFMHLRLFFGGGMLLGTDDGGFTSSLRIPVGLSMPFRNSPVNFSFYCAPSFVIKPESDLGLNFGFAARYNFGTASIDRDKLQARLDSANSGLNESRRRLEGLNSSLNQTLNELDKTRNELSSARGNLQSTKENLDSAREKLLSTRNELDQTRGKLDRTSEELVSTKTKLDTTESALSSVKKELDDSREQLDSAKKDLAQTKRELDDREKTFREKQAELDILKNIAHNAYSGEKREQEEKRIAGEQKDLDRQKKDFNKKKDQYQEKQKSQETSYLKFKERCEGRRGVINEEGYCTCRKHETWNTDKSSCVCVKGYRLNRSSDQCDPCEIIDYYGNCATQCKKDERMVRLTSGPHAYVCAKRCSGANETWSERKGQCVCGDGYDRDGSGACVKRR
jgi:predicted  nucleic acid-binding Zn-ribbon protein